MLDKFKKILSEALILKKDTANKKLIVVSNSADEKVAKQETYFNKADLKDVGFYWNGKLGAWEIDLSKFDTAKETINKINKKRKYTSDFIEKVEQLEEFVAALSIPGTDKNNLKEKISLYIDDLSNVTDEASLSAEIRRYLTFFSKFKGHSLYNTLLIYLQNPNATRVAGFKQWEEKHHRHVKKGAKGIWILAPKFYAKGKTKESNAELDDAVEKGNPHGFFPVSVFDIKDTEPIDERGEVPEQPEWFGENKPSAVADKLFSYVEILAGKLGIKVTHDDAHGGEKGFSANKHINLSSDISGVGQISTMIHEIAHELMHWKTSSPFYVDAENKMDKSPNKMRELQAESVSYIVLKHYDLPVTHHPTYLALWGANKEKIKQNLDVIQKVAAYLIEKIDEIAEQQEGKEVERVAEPEGIEEIRKIVRGIIMEAALASHYQERIRDRFLNPEEIVVGYEIPGSVGEYEEVGNYKLSPELKNRVIEVTSVLEKYNFPKNKSYAVKVTDIIIDKNKIEYFSEGLKKYVAEKNPILLFVDSYTKSNGNQIYAIIRQNKVETAFFGKSYSMENMDIKDKLKVDVYIKDLNIIKNNQVR